ncbi:MAG: ABC transporter ATP-binding protein [Thermacetogeniaceae bacterium]|jgi:putative ABC transport system ATP-binding protein
MISISELSKTYGAGEASVAALSGVSLEIGDGEFVSIMGPSGSGKSTFLSLLGCLERPSSGQYLVDGRDTGALSDDELAFLRALKFGFVFQAYNLMPRYGTMRNVELPLIYAGVGRRERAGRAEDLLRRVGLGHRLRHKPTELSGGEQQRVAIARALVNDPAVILADEPTGNLDSKAGQDVMAIFRELNAEGRTIILVTHELKIARYAGRMLHFLDGRLVGEEVHP